MITVKELKALIETVPDDAAIVLTLDGEWADKSEVDILRYESDEGVVVIGVS